MAENKTPPPAVKGPSLSDTNARDSFIASALREIVSWQMAEGKINHEQAGALAVRYGNSAMKWRGVETAPLSVTVAKGTHEVAPPAPVIPPEPPTPTEAPKSIAEIIGEVEPAVELK